jgi:acyl-CoA synthetase (AMP-forming)/AMP-acid ligase II
MLAETVREAGRRFGPLRAFVDPSGAALTYADLDRRSDAVAAGLARRGVGIDRADRVALLLPSDSGYVIAYAALAKLGAVTAGVNPRLAPGERAAVVDVADPALVLATPEELAAVFNERQLEAVSQIETGGAWATPVAGGGTGGPPMLASTQFAHVGFMLKVAWYLRMAVRMHILERWRADDALRLVASERMTSVGGVAPQFALMLRSPELARHDWSWVTTVIAGGAASPPALVDGIRRALGAAYSIRYSSTESGGCGTGTAFDAGDEEALYTVGRPRGGIEVAVREADGRPLPDGEVGELWLRSPTQMSGYWRDSEATAEALVDGWLRTGDLARIDDAGCVRLAGRRTEMYIRGGYNVYPAEVEARLSGHPDLAEAAVVPRPDPVMGEVGVAVVVPRPGRPAPALADLRAYLADELASYKLPEAVRVVEGLPLTPMLKVDRRRLAADEASAPTP